VRAVHEGLGILLEYAQQNENSNFSVGHDEIHASGPPVTELDKNDVQRLDELGWFWNDEFECWSKFV